VRGDVAGDLAHLFAASSEPESALVLEAEAGEEEGRAWAAESSHGGDGSAGGGGISFCGGALAQRVAEGGGHAPSAGHGFASFEEVARRVRALRLGELAARGVPLEETARALLLMNGTAALEEGATILSPSVPLDFFCRCAKPALLAAMRRAGGDALVRDLLQEHDAAAAAAAAGAQNAAAAQLAAAARFGGLRVEEVVTTLTCGSCNRRHYVSRRDLE